MMRYIEIFAYLDAEISRLQRARDILSDAYALKSKPSKKKTSAPKRKAGTTKLQPAISAQADKPHLQMQRMPRKSKAKTQRIARVPQNDQEAAGVLSSQVPSGPVAVSREEVRKVRDREVALAQAAQLPQAIENPSSERSLGSLIRAMASKQGLDGLIS